MRSLMFKFLTICNRFVKSNTQELNRNENRYDMLLESISSLLRTCKEL